MTEQEQDEIREAFEQFFLKKYFCTSAFARNEYRYFDSEVEMAWQAFQAGFNYAKGER